MKKKPTSYIIWGMAIVPLILSVAFWIFLYATRQLHEYPIDVPPFEEEVVIYPPEHQKLDKAVLYLGDNDLDIYVYGYDSCSVEGQFCPDTLVIISNDKSINVYKQD